jgi:predicted transglutaminase-like cysteine proteinase
MRGPTTDKGQMSLLESRLPRSLFLTSAWRCRFWCWGQIVLGLLLTGAVASVLSAWDADRQVATAQRMGPAAAAAVRAWQQTIAQAAAMDEESRLVTINQFINRRVNFRDDIDGYGVQDYWATPVESVGHMFGDCEDYAIAKYSGLLAAGIPAQRLRLVYVRASIGGAGGPQLAHMVLAYYPPSGAEPLILDNLAGEIRPASRRPDLTPVFSFNTDGLWQGAQGSVAGDPVARLSKWRDVLSRAREEGSF